MKLFKDTVSSPEFIQSECDKMYNKLKDCEQGECEKMYNKLKDCEQGTVGGLEFDYREGQKFLYFLVM